MEAASTPEPWDRNIPYDPIPVAWILVIVAVVAILLNLLVLVVSYRGKLYRNSANMLVISLALSDFLFVTHNLPTIVSFLYQKYRGLDVLPTIFEKLPIVCKINGFLNEIAVISSMLTITLITVERYLRVVLSKTVEPERLGRWLIIAWIGAAGAAAFPWIGNQIHLQPAAVGVETYLSNGYVMQPSLTYCMIDWTSPTVFDGVLKINVFLILNATAGALVGAFFRILTQFQSNQKALAAVGSSNPYNHKLLHGSDDQGLSDTFVARTIRVVNRLSSSLSAALAFRKESQRDPEVPSISAIKNKDGPFLSEFPPNEAPASLTVSSPSLCASPSLSHSPSFGKPGELPYLGNGNPMLLAPAGDLLSVRKKEMLLTSEQLHGPKAQSDKPSILSLCTAGTPWNQQPGIITNDGGFSGKDGFAGVSQSLGSSANPLMISASTANNTTLNSTAISANTRAAQIVREARFAPPADPSSKAGRESKQLQAMLMRRSVAIVGSYLLSWLVYDAVILWSWIVLRPVPSTFDAASGILASLICVWNPLLSLVLDMRFRNGLKAIWLTMVGILPPILNGSSRRSSANSSAAPSPISSEIQRSNSAEARRKSSGQSSQLAKKFFFFRRRSKRQIALLNALVNQDPYSENHQHLPAAILVMRSRSQRFRSANASHAPHDAQKPKG